MRRRTRRRARALGSLMGRMVPGRTASWPGRAAWASPPACGESPAPLPSCRFPSAVGLQDLQAKQGECSACVMWGTVNIERQKPNSDEFRLKRNVRVEAGAGPSGLVQVSVGPSGGKFFRHGLVQWGHQDASPSGMVWSSGAIRTQVLWARLGPVGPWPACPHPLLRSRPWQLSQCSCRKGSGVCVSSLVSRQ